MLQVISSQPQIYINLCHEILLKIGHSQLPGNPFGSIGHELHESSGTRTGCNVDEKPAFLTNNAINPGFINILLFCNGMKRFAMRRWETQPEIMLFGCSVCGIDRSIKMPVTLCNFGCREKLPVIKMSNGPHPLPIRFSTQIHPVKSQGTLNTGHFFHGKHFFSGDRNRIFCCRKYATQLFFSKLPVIIMRFTERYQNFIGINRQPFFFKRPRPPILPCTICLLFGGHALYGFQHIFPVSAT